MHSFIFMGMNSHSIELFKFVRWECTVKEIDLHSQKYNLDVDLIIQ